jgi:hypothetical protein
MSIFKTINKKDILLTESTVNRTVNLTNNNDGLVAINYRSGSSINSGSYWTSLRVNYYLSGSDVETKFNNPAFVFGIENSKNPQHKNKFFTSGSLISIPQQYFGDEIKRNSFTFTSSSVIIKDDGFGNLYPVGNSISQSINSPSSSNNYVGNIFYNTGIVNITETGSFSSSLSYMNLVDNSFNVKFDSTHTIYSTEYKLLIKSNEFNVSNNVTSRAYISSSGFLGSTDKTQSPLLSNNLTGSGWSPYISTIGLYDDENKLIMVTRYSQPIKTTKDIDITFKIKQDW